MLTGVNDHFLDRFRERLSDCAADSSSFDELRPGADDGTFLASSCRLCSLIYDNYLMIFNGFLARIHKSKM